MVFAVFCASQAILSWDRHRAAFLTEIREWENCRETVFLGLGPCTRHVVEANVSEAMLCPLHCVHILTWLLARRHSLPQPLRDPSSLPITHV